VAAVAAVADFDPTLGIPLQGEQVAAEVLVAAVVGLVMPAVIPQQPLPQGAETAAMAL
jgi:hypothetical protein